jgi:hypothetical protein
VYKSSQQTLRLKPLFVPDGTNSSAAVKIIVVNGKNRPERQSFFFICAVMHGYQLNKVSSKEIVYGQPDKADQTVNGSFVPIADMPFGISLGI